MLVTLKMHIFKYGNEETLYVLALSINAVGIDAYQSAGMKWRDAAKIL